MYRCVALKTLESNIDITKPAKIIEIAKNIKIDLLQDGTVLLDGVDVTKEIRSKEVTNVVSPISSIKEVREYMVIKQREIAKGKDIVMEGRDITTVVFPDAPYKFYLDASIESRAKRRYQENLEKGIESSFEEILENIRKRDYNDMHKEVGSLTRTEDSYYIDSTNMAIDEVVEKIKKIIEV